MHAGRVHAGECCKPSREMETSELHQQQLNRVSVAVCHCHQDLLDAVDANILTKDFVGRSTVRMNCLESLEY